MTLLHLHHGDVRGLGREQRFPLWQALRRIGAAFSALHRGIVGAKLRHAQSELLFRGDCNELLHPGQDAPSASELRNFPQRPLLLGDKWDF
jgi:hypothetical protein